MKNEEDYFETTDLGLATTIATLGFELDSLDQSNLNRVKFIFQRGDGFEGLVQGYWRNELTVDPLTYFNNIKLLKNRIYSR